MNCPGNDKLSAYHDGEMPPDEIAAIESHLASCEPCGQFLAQLRSMSSLFTAASRPALSQIGRHRLHQRADTEMQAGILRLAWTLSGLAASVLVVGSIWSTGLVNTKEATQSPPPWVNVALAPESDARPTDAVTDSSTPVAAFYLADASSSSSNDDTP